MKKMLSASAKRQRGAETLEFIVVFGVLMMMIIAVFDFGRVMYVWNALAEATRRGARVAVVCPSNQNNIVQNVAVFDVVNGTLGTSPVVKGLDTEAISIAYYDAAGNKLANPPPSDINIAFVEVSINQSYQFNFIIPDMPYLGIFTDINNNPFAVPAFKTTLYAESKGAVPTLPGAEPIAPSCNF